MPDGVYPPTKPAVNGSSSCAVAGAGAAKPQLRPPYRPQPYHRRRSHRRTRRNFCCCFCFWTILAVLALALLAAIAGAALYVLYRPHRPQFSITSVRISKLNLTVAGDSPSSGHLSSLLNVSLSSSNPNSHISFSYDPFLLSCLSNSVVVANGSVPAFTSGTKNQTVFRAAMAGAEELDADSVTSLRSDLKKKGGVPLTVEMDTKVKVKIGGLNTKKVGIRVTCEGIKGVVPRDKSPALASVAGAECKVDLRIKIWIFTL